MSVNYINKLVWIVETIHNEKRITFNELNEKWKNAVDLSGGVDMEKRTFHKWKGVIFDTFGIIIDCEKCAPYQYYIANEDDIKNGSVESWLMSTYAVCNSLVESKSIKDRILLEDVPSGRNYLQPIIEAMKGDRFVHFTYYTYYNNQKTSRYVLPLCVKLFRQRWYMVGRQFPTGKDTIFCLDRMSDFRMGSHTEKYPEDFSPKDYFYGCFGIINDENCNIETVKLKVTAGQANYWRALPLHNSQKEVERMEEFSIFELRVRPTFDFEQELLWNREMVEVLEPVWLRKEMADIVKVMEKKYAKTNKQ